MAAANTLPQADSTHWRALASTASMLCGRVVRHTRAVDFDSVSKRLHSCSTIGTYLCALYAVSPSAVPVSLPAPCTASSMHSITCLLGADPVRLSESFTLLMYLLMHSRYSICMCSGQCCELLVFISSIQLYILAQQQLKYFSKQ
jgi:hypothetical protein